jgi:hypothetical protein
VIRRTLFVLAVAAGSAACGEIPQPFRHEGDIPSLARPKMMRAVTVRVPDGDNGPLLAEALVKALEEQEVPALVHGGPAFGHVIEGTVEDSPKVLAVRWTLKGPDGSPAATTLQAIPKTLLADPAPVLLKRAAADTATRLAQPLADPDAQPVHPVETAAAGNRPSVTVVPLRGLPGDGDKALTLAIRRALEGSTVLVKDKGADYMVEGKVTVAPGLPGEDTVTVAWILKRAKDSVELGNVGQQGAVPRGRLSGAWGSMARDIAEGGAAGLVDVIRADTTPAPRR